MLDFGRKCLQKSFACDYGPEIVSIFTKTSTENLGLKEGKDVYAIIKATNVILGTD